MDDSAATPPGFTDLLSAPPNVSAAWDAFSLFLVGATPAHATGAFADHALGLYLSGRHRIRREISADCRYRSASQPPRAGHISTAHARSHLLDKVGTIGLRLSHRHSLASRSMD